MLKYANEDFDKDRPIYRFNSYNLLELFAVFKQPFDVTSKVTNHCTTEEHIELRNEFKSSKIK